jgi:hypothetical protein
MRSRSVAVMVLSLLVIAGATSFEVRGQILHLFGADRPIPGSAPHAIGNTWACPPVWNKAYQSRYFYPSYHPAPPSLQTKPTRCYRTDAEARAAGYKLAPAPPGTAVIDGVYLVPASSLVKSSCQAAATQLRIAIPCPTLLPTDVEDLLCSPSSVCTDTGTFVTLIAFPIRRDFPGALGDPSAAARAGFVALGQGQLSLIAAPLSSRDGQLMEDLQLSASGGLQLGPPANLCVRGNSRPTVMQRPALWTTCGGSDGPSATYLTWVIDQAIYSVSSPGQASANQRLVQFFASKLTPVLPAGA